MLSRCRRYFCLLMASAALCAPHCAANVAHGQVVITEIMHSPDGSDPLWEWIEIRNVTGSPLNLDGWVLDDDDDTSFAAANISADDGDTIVPAGGVAVLYPGDELEFNPERFSGAWGDSFTLIGVNGFTSLTATDAVGLWSSHASYQASAIPMATSSPRRTFVGAVAAIDYTDNFPTAESGHSIAWNGNGSVTNGSNWRESQQGLLYAF